MALAAKRYGLFGDDYNVPTIDISTVDPADVLNADVPDGLNLSSASMSNILGNSLPDAGSLDAAKGLLADAKGSGMSLLSDAKGSLGDLGSGLKGKLGDLSSSVSGNLSELGTGIKGSLPDLPSLPSIPGMPKLPNLSGITNPGALGDKLGLLGKFKDTTPKGLYDEITGIVRKARDPNKIIGNASDIGLQELEKANEGLFVGNDPARAAFRNLGRACKDLILSGLGLNKFKNGVNFGGQYRNTNKNPCGLENFAGFLNSVTGNYVPDIRDKNALLKVGQSAVERGLEIGFPGVYTSMNNFVNDNKIMQTIGLSTINKSAAKGDVHGIMEVANSPQGSSLLGLNPNIAAVAMTGFKFPSEVNQDGVKEFSTSFKSSMSNLDPNYNRYSLGDGSSMMSVAKFPLGNADFSGMLGAGLRPPPGDVVGSWADTEVSDDEALFAGHRLYDAESTGEVSTSNAMANIRSTLSEVNDQSDVSRNITPRHSAFSGVSQDSVVYTGPLPLPEGYAIGSDGSFVQVFDPAVCRTFSGPVEPEDMDQSNVVNLDIEEI